MTYQICTSCVMDTSDTSIDFDESGVCTYCRRWAHMEHPTHLDSEAARRQLDEIVQSIKKRSKSKDYDCVVGLSGGVDSTFAALRARELGLRPLAVHVDTGWNSELAVSNVESIVKSLDLDLHTHVVDWEEMRNLQLAFMKASVSNCDIPQDHAIVAVLYRVAAKYRTRTIVSGQNLSTESILPKSWGYANIDKKHIVAIHRRFGTGRLRRFPSFNLFQYAFWWPFVHGIRVVSILNMTPYIKSIAKQRIQDELGWRDYGGKHHESRFTKYYQAYYLPTKFGIDKRRAHLSSLIVSGQMSRDEALADLEKPLFGNEELANTKFFMAKKLGITESELQDIIEQPRRAHQDYPSNEKLIARLQEIKARFAR